MVELPGLYFVIANDTHARFVRPDPDNRPHTIRAVEHNVFSDERFARFLAVNLNGEFSADVFSHLILVAPSPVLREVIAALDVPTRTSLIDTIAADLVTVPDQDLQPHLRAWLCET